MKKTVFFLSLFLFSFFADANPLFWPGCARIEITDRYEYFYDEQGTLLGCEDRGESGYVYAYLGENNWEEQAYFVVENGWCLYYYSFGQNTYVGKVRTSSELFRDGDRLYDKETRYYVDERNRPVATYEQALSGQVGEGLSTFLGSLENYLNPLGALMNGGKASKHIFLVRKGRTRIYSD